MRSASIYKKILCFLAVAAVCAAPLFAAEKTEAVRIVIEKRARLLIVYSGVVKLKEYKIAIGRGGTGRKLRKGDALTPEGKYRISGRNPQSKYHKALRVSYPNKEDEARAAASGAR